MHLLNATAPARDDTVAIDLGQTPGDIVILSAADSDLACLARAASRLGDGFPSVRLANLLRLGHPYSVDLHVESVLSRAKVVLVRLLGGVAYWRYGVERLEALARDGLRLVVLGGEAARDLEAERHSNIDAATRARLHEAFAQGGVDNAERALRTLAGLIGHPSEVESIAPVPGAGIYRRARPEAPASGAALILFYRALVLAGDTAPVDALVAALAARGLAVTALFLPSLKDPAAQALIAEQPAPDVVVNLTGFAVAAGGGEAALDRLDCPVLQAILAGIDVADWRAGQRGLGPRDLAMHIALPEIDGRIGAGVLSFKRAAARDPLTQADIAAHEPVPDRVAHVADLAAAWARLRRTPAAERGVALMLANYPNRDGRLGNGVGLDTPAATVAILQSLAAAGYRVADLPEDAAALMRDLLAGPTNDVSRRAERRVTVGLSLTDYRRAFAALPSAVREAVTARWGAPESDPHVVDEAFALSALRFGNALVMIQPARGYNIDPATSYHDPALVPPHHYLAAYVFIREAFNAHAILHVGKHGTLEWLPGKSVALSETCFPEAALGPLPHLYPFIVNDPGEGTQAKRRSGAVILDHLTPPLTRAESYGPMADLEALVDEYYAASVLDPRRRAPLAKALLDLAGDTGLAADCGIVSGEDVDAALIKLDGFLCQVKELQIRDGLHVFGTSPTGRQRSDLAVAIARGSRGLGEGRDRSLIRALADDLGLAFDPLAADMAKPWIGPRPMVLASIVDEPWRTAGDAVERLERLASRLVDGETAPEPGWSATRAVLDWARGALLPALDACGAAEMAGLLKGLDGRFVPPGPSGAPTRGRPDVLPTGRNFHSVDTRAVPTPAAWALGWRSAQMLVERFAQDHGHHPTRMALSAWGTACMRTGGDDIAQAMALIGARPSWDPGSGRLSGFEILPASLLDRPRVDVTLRVSGFFRDAFPGLIDLFDRAARAVAALDEPAEVNPLRAAVQGAVAALMARGMDPAAARRQAGFRVFGAQPGSYGAGLQALIDEGGWSTRADFAEAFLAWGGTAYGSDGAGGIAEGLPARDRLASLLTSVEAIIHNQDNREHDILDSDDYYQFAGGLAATVATLSGRDAAIYHNDHSRPDAPRIERLEREIAMVLRGRAANPKWLAGVRRHGYKGAADMAATVDYLFAFAATTGLVANHQFDALFEAYLDDPAVAGFVREANPDALREMAGRFEEAIARGLWRPRANHASEVLARHREGRDG